MNKQEFIKYLKDINITLTDYQLEQLDKYYHLLINWNEKMNLTAITKEEDVYLKHFYDSLTISKVINLTNESICDIGSGAGFPGIVLKICFPNLKITLLDSLNKRINFLNEVIKELNLTDITAIHARAEDFAKKNNNTFDIVTSRAVAKLNILLEYAIPMTKINGYFVAMKANINDEIINSKNAISTLNCKIIDTKELYLPKENSLRTLIKVQKLSQTPALYPRNFDKINKNPL